MTTTIPSSVRARARYLANECHTIDHPECHDAQHAKALAVCEYLAGPHDDLVTVGEGRYADAAAVLAAWATSEEEP